MHTVTLEEACLHLPELVAGAGKGEEIVITKDGAAVAKLLAATEPEGVPPANRAELFGLLKGKITFQEGWDETPEDFKPYME
jgi:antitoxin (DNA-binding transcriptional repressor) of toxin-antitoxin stability system